MNPDSIRSSIRFLDEQNKKNAGQESINSAKMLESFPELQEGALTKKILAKLISWQSKNEPLPKVLSLANLANFFEARPSQILPLLKTVPGFLAAPESGKYQFTNFEEAIVHLETILGVKSPEEVTGDTTKLMNLFRTNPSTPYLKVQLSGLGFTNNEISLLDGLAKKGLITKNKGLTARNRPVFYYQLNPQAAHEPETPKQEAE